jgi:alpha-1,2-mannosyltransferase
LTIDHDEAPVRGRLSPPEPPAGGREAVQTFCLLVVAAFAAACLQAWLAPGSPVTEQLAVRHSVGRAAWLPICALLALIFAVVACPRYPARGTGWGREVAPLLLGGALLSPGQPLLPAAAPPLPLWLALLVAGTLWWRRRAPGRSALAASLAAAIPDRRWRIGVVGAAAGLLIYLFAVQFGEMERVATIGTDFGTFYRAAAAMREGADPYRALDGFLYPPVFAWALRPLLLLSVVEASLLWFLLKLTLVTWTFHLADRLLLGSALGGRRRGWFLFGLVTVAGRFWVTDLRFGNTNDLVLFLSTGVLIWSRSRPLRAGICLAVAAAIKVVPLLLAAYLVTTGRWRALAGAAVGLALLVMVPRVLEPKPLATAWESYRATQVSASVTERRDQPDNQSLWGALARSVPVTTGGLRLLWLAGSCTLVAAGTWATWRARRGGALQEAGAAALWPLLVLLVSPGSWVVHYVAMLLPLAALLRFLLAVRRPSAATVLVFAAANLVLIGSGLWRWSVRLAADGSLFVLAALAVYVTLASLVVRTDAYANADAVAR